jgi:DegV family protein with EDD domain
MKIHIVTDSSADISPELAEKLGVTVVPLYVRFGEQVFRERVNITDDEFYERLCSGGPHPVTIQPSPQDFFDVYHRLSKQADAIVSVHLGGKLSGTYNSALLAKNMFTNNFPIKVIDSQSASAGLGLIVMEGLRSIAAGQDTDGVVAAINTAIPRTHIFALLDTLRYLVIGGRIGKAKAMVGSMLGVKPIIALKDGEVVPSGQARNRARGIERLVDYVRSARNPEDVAVAYSTTSNDAKALADQIGSVFTRRPIQTCRLGTTIGIHTGPGTLVVSYMEGTVS